MNSFKPKLGRRNPVKTEGHFLLRLCSFAWLAEKILKRLAKLLSLFGHPKKRALPIEVGFDTKCCLEKEVHFLLAGWIISMICIPPTSKILNWGASIPALPNTWKCLGALNHPNRYLRAPKQQTNKRFPKHQSSQTPEFFRSFTLWQRTIPEIAFFNGSQCRFWILKKISGPTSIDLSGGETLIFFFGGGNLEMRKDSTDSESRISPKCRTARILIEKAGDYILPSYIWKGS